jgi:hypothetical protein
LPDLVDNHVHPPVHNELRRRSCTGLLDNNQDIEVAGLDDDVAEANLAGAGEGGTTWEVTGREEVGVNDDEPPPLLLKSGTPPRVLRPQVWGLRR